MPVVEKDRRGEFAGLFNETVSELKGTGKAAGKAKQGEFGRDVRGCEREEEEEEEREETDFFYRGNGFGPRFEGGGISTQCAQM